MNFNRKLLITVRILSDVIILCFSYMASMYITHNNRFVGLGVNDYVFLSVLIIIWLLSTKITGLYKEFRSRNFSFELITIFKCAVTQMLTAIVILFIITEIRFSREFVFSYSAFLIFLLSAEKYLFRTFLYFLRRRGRNLRSILIIGTGAVGTGFYESILNNPHYGYHVVGFLDDEKKPWLNGKYLGNIYRLEKVLSRTKVDDVIVALANNTKQKLDWIITTCEKYTTRVRVAPEVGEYISGKYSNSMFGQFPIISVNDDRINVLYWRIWKRTFDIVISLCLLIFVFPWFWFVIFILIKSTSEGPVFYKQERWGRNYKKFIAYKFRTMVIDRNDFNGNGYFKQARPNDPRVTKIGRILRKTNLDELPQFWNVLFGDMSIVGPRPHPGPLNNRFKSCTRRYMSRYLVKPGLTGWAQINGYRGLTKTNGDMQKRIDHDLWYIENWSFWLDIQIVLLTIRHMIKGDPNAY